MTCSAPISTTKTLARSERVSRRVARHVTRPLRCFAQWPARHASRRGANSGGRRRGQRAAREQNTASHPHRREANALRGPGALGRRWVRPSRSSPGASTTCRSSSASSTTSSSPRTGSATSPTEQPQLKKIAKKLADRSASAPIARKALAQHWKAVQDLHARQALVTRARH